MKLVKSLLLLLLFLGAGAGLYVWFSQPRLWSSQPRPIQAQRAQAATPADKSSVPVEIALVRLATVTDAVETVGSLVANESVVMSPELGGRVEAIEFDEGEPVEKGQALIILDDDIYQAELAQAKASLELSRTNYQRAQKLLRRSAGSVSARDEALAQQRLHEATLALAQARLEKRTIKAPFGGTVGLRTISVGDYVQPGQDLITLVDADPVKVDFRIPEAFLPSVRTGQTIEVKLDAYPGQVFEGTVYAISPVVDVNGRSLLLRARIPNPDGYLKPGQFARVDLIFDLREDALLVPEEALVPRGDERFVFRVVDGKAVMTRVQIGDRIGDDVEIISGLNEGDRVVTAGQLKISDGAAVRPVGDRQG